MISIKKLGFICTLIAAACCFGGCGYGYEENPIGGNTFITNPVIISIDPDPEDPDFCL